MQLKLCKLIVIILLLIDLMYLQKSRKFWYFIILFKKTGVFYVSGRDAYMRPILVFDIDKMIRQSITEH